MDRSTEYLLTKLYIEKLTRNKYPVDPGKAGAQKWTTFKAQREVAEDTFGFTFVPTEKTEAFMWWELTSLCIQFWKEAVKNQTVEY